MWVIWIFKKETKRIESIYQTVLKLDKFNNRALAGLAWVTSMYHQYHKLESSNAKTVAKEFESAIEETSAFPEGYYEYGEYLLFQKDTMQALDNYYQSYKIDPYHFESVTRILELETDVKRRKKIINAIILDSISSSNPELTYKIAQYEFFNQNEKGAKEFLKQGIEKDPEYAYSKHFNNCFNKITTVNSLQQLKSMVVFITPEGNSINVLDDSKMFIMVNPYTNQSMPAKISYAETIKNLGVITYLVEDTILKMKNVMAFQIYFLKQQKGLKKLAYSYKLLGEKALGIAINEGTYLYSMEGEALTDLAFSEVNYLKETELILVSKNKKYGCFSNDGKLVIPIDYEKIETFTHYEKKGEKRIAVYLVKCTVANSNKTILLDKNGKEYKP